MKRIGIYGGTFNPPHVGHVRAVRYALCALELDKLLVIPAGINPGKEKTEATPAQRLEMTKLAMGNIPGVTVTDMELRREGISYTADTLKEIKALYPEAEMYKEMSFISYYFHWGQDDVLRMEHAERRRWCEEISSINSSLNPSEKKKEKSILEFGRRK